MQGEEAILRAEEIRQLDDFDKSFVTLISIEVQVLLLSISLLFSECVVLYRE